MKQNTIIFLVVVGIVVAATIVAYYMMSDGIEDAIEKVCSKFKLIDEEEDFKYYLVCKQEIPKIVKIMKNNQIRDSSIKKFLSCLSTHLDGVNKVQELRKEIELRCQLDRTRCWIKHKSGKYEVQSPAVIADYAAAMDEQRRVEHESIQCILDIFSPSELDTLVSALPFRESSRGFVTAISMMFRSANRSAKVVAWRKADARRKAEEIDDLSF